MTTAAGAADQPAAIGLARLVAAHHDARAFYRDQLLRADGPRHYLTNRGLGLLTRRDHPRTRDAAPWRIGYAPPGWTNLVDHLTGHGYSPSELVAAGLATHTRTGSVIDVFRDRIVFPIHNPHGYPVAFLGRAAPTAGPGVPKYLNTPDTIAYHKGQILYGHGEQTDRIAAGAEPTLVEGPVDVLAVWLTHLDASRIAVAACGTALTARHAAAIAAMPGATRRGITTAFDNDDAGRRATLRAWQLLCTYPRINLYAATLPDHTDPGDLMTTPGCSAALRAALSDRARPLAQAVIDIRLGQLIARHPDLLHWTGGRVQAARALTGLVVGLTPDQIVCLSSYIAQCTNTGFDTVAQAVIDHLERSPPTGTDDAGILTFHDTPRRRTFLPLDASAIGSGTSPNVAHERHPGRHAR